MTALLNSGSIAFTRQPRDGHPSGGWYLMNNAIRCHQRSSEAIRRHQRPSGVIRGHQRLSAHRPSASEILDVSLQRGQQKSIASTYGRTPDARITLPRTWGEGAVVSTCMQARTPDARITLPRTCGEVGDQRRSTAISGHQQSSAAINSHQRSSAAISGHQRPSAAIHPRRPP